jgi:hypothetical protein
MAYSEVLDCLAQKRRLYPNPSFISQPTVDESNPLPTNSKPKQSQSVVKVNVHEYLVKIDTDRFDRHKFKIEFGLGDTDMIRTGTYEILTCIDTLDVDAIMSFYGVIDACKSAKCL